MTLIEYSDNFAWSPYMFIPHSDPQKAASVQAMLADFFVKIADIFKQENASSYLGFSHGNFKNWDEVKEPVVL